MPHIKIVLTSVLIYHIGRRGRGVGFLLLSPPPLTKVMYTPLQLLATIFSRAHLLHQYLSIEPYRITLNQCPGSSIVRRPSPGLPWSFYSIVTININSEIGAHVCTEICILICIRDLFRSAELENFKLFSLQTCTKCSELSNISNIGADLI